MPNLPAPLFRFMHLFLYLYGIISRKSLFYKNVHKWFFVDGNNKYLLNYPLNKDSTIFEVGGYTGVFTDEAIKKFDCSLYVFEPIEEYYTILVEKYKDNEKVKVFQFGLGNTNTTLEMGLSNDGTSAFKKGKTETVEIRKFSQFLSENGINHIDLISINIEGGEYDLIDDIVSSDAISMIEYIQVQFHDFVDDATEKRKNSLKNIEKTHTSIYGFPFVWEAFRLKK